MKKIKSTFLILFSIMLLIHNAYSQKTQKCNQDIFNDTVLDRLTGQWMATGYVGSSSVVYNFSVEWVLNHQFLEITFADTSNVHEYTAKVFIGYDCKKDRYVTHWIDNFGGAFSETLGYGIKKEQSIILLFEYPNGQLNNAFSYEKKNDEWTSHSEMKDEKGNWVTFGHIVLKRKSIR